MEIIWSTNAIEDLKAIYLFYLDKNRQAATKIQDKIISELNRLLNFPFIGQIEIFSPEGEEEYRSLSVRPHYKIIYILHANQIHVVSIRDCRQNPETLIESVHKK